MSIAPTYRYKFNNALTDSSGNGGPTMNKGSTAVLSTTNLTIDCTNANSYFNSPAGTLYNLGANPYTMAFWISLGPNFNNFQNVDTFSIGNGTANNLGATTMYLTHSYTGQTFRFSIVNSSNSQSQLTLSGCAMSGSTKYLLMISYNPTTSGSSGMTVAFAPQGSIQSAVQITSISTALLQKSNALHEFISRPVLASTGGQSFVVEDMQIYSGTGMYFGISNYMDIMNAGPDGALGTHQVANTFTASWKTYKSASQSTNSLSWKTYKSASQNTNSLSWNVKAPVTQSKTLSWRVYSPSSKNFTLSWKAYKTISKNSSNINWTTFGTQPSNNLTLDWEVFSPNQISNSFTLSYTVEAYASQEVTFSWETESQISQFCNQLSWKNYKSVSKTEALSWKVYSNSQVSKSQMLSWKTYAHVQQNQSLSWDTHALLLKAFSLSWKLGGPIIKSANPILYLLGGQTSDLVPTLFWSLNGVLDMAFGLQAYKFPKFRIPNNVNYELFRNITITNTSGATFPVGSTVEFNLDTAAMFGAGDIDEFCDNFRLTWVPNNRAEKELDLAILSPNTSSTTLRFQIQESLANGSATTDYRLYYRIKNPNLYEETFRDSKGVYYFEAKRLSSLLAKTNGTFSNAVEGIQRDADGNTAYLGFNVPDNAFVEVDFRFLDVGATNNSCFLGLDWRGNGNTNNTYRLDNDAAPSVFNKIDQYYNGSHWANLATEIQEIWIKPATMGLRVIGSTVQLYLNGTLLETVTDATAPTGGMQLIFPPTTEVNIAEIRVRQAIGTYTVSLSSALENLTSVSSSLSIRLDDTRVQKLQSTVARLKRQPDNTFILEDIRTIGEAGEAYDATVGQDNSLEIHMANVLNSTLSTVKRMDT